MHINDDLINKGAIFACNSSSGSIVQQQPDVKTNIYFNTIVSKCGKNIDKRIILDDNGNIKIISNDINHVKVTVGLWVERAENSYVVAYLTKNNAPELEYDRAILGENASSVWGNLKLSGLIDVKKNDVISVSTYWNVYSQANRVPCFYGKSVNILVEIID